jgi:hypothetical protein
MSAGITRTNRTVLDSQGAFVAGNSRRTVRRTPANCFGTRSSRLGAFGPRDPRLPSRAVVVLSDHVWIACFARSLLTATSVVVVSRAASSPSGLLRHAQPTWVRCHVATHKVVERQQLAGRSFTLKVGLRAFQRRGGTVGG